MRIRIIFDLGLCGPLRTDFRGRAEYCGLLHDADTAQRRAAADVLSQRRRSTACARPSHSMSSATPIRANGTRATLPAQILKFDDLPRAYRDNVNMEPPFGGSPGDRPVLDAKRDRRYRGLSQYSDRWLHAGAMNSRRLHANIAAAGAAALGDDPVENGDIDLIETGEKTWRRRRHDDLRMRNHRGECFDVRKRFDVEPAIFLGASRAVATRQRARSCRGASTPVLHR